MFNLIKKGNTDAHIISYDALQGFDDLEENIKVEEAEDYNMEELSERKQRLLDEIQKLEEQAEIILQDAETVAQELKDEASKQGYEAGYEKGYSDGSDKGFEEALQEGTRQVRRESNELLNDLKKIIEHTEEKKQDILNRYQEDLKDIAISVAEKVVHVSLKSSGDIIKRMILSATEGMQSREWAKIYISKTDSQLMVQGDTNLLEEISYLSDHIKIIVMEGEVAGTCIIELPDKVLDASANTQIANIREILSSGRI